MKIPVPDLPRANVRPIGTPYDNAREPSPLTELSKGFGDLAQGVERVVERADAVNVAEQAGLYGRYGTSVLVGRTAEAAAQARGRVVNPAFPAGPDPDAALYPAGNTGFLSSVGEESVRLSTPTLEALEKRRLEQMKGLKNERQRALFDEKSRTMLDAWRAKVEGHTSGQIQETQKAKAKVLEDEVEDYAAAFHNDEAEITRRLTDAQRLRGLLALSPEQAKAEADAIDAKVSTVRLEKYIAKGDWKGAEELLNRKRPILGKVGVQLEGRLHDKQRAAFATETAQSFIARARNDEGFVDHDHATDMLEELTDAEKREDVRKELEDQLISEGRSWKAKVEDRYGSALESFLRSGKSLKNIPDEDREWLLRNARDEWLKLERLDMEHKTQLRVLANEEQRRLEKEQTKAEKREAAEMKVRDERRKVSQAAARFDAKSDMQANPARYHAMSDAQFKNTWSHRVDDAGFKDISDRFLEVKQRDITKTTEQSKFLEDYIATESKYAKDKEEAALLRYNFDEAVRTFRVKEKREPTFSELPERLNEAFTLRQVHGPIVRRIGEALGFDMSKTEQVLRKKGEAPAPNPNPNPNPNLNQKKDPPPPSKPDMTYLERAQQLKAAGFDKAGTKDVLKSEGYDLTTGAR